MDSNGSPEFGDRVAGVEYVPRPGAYALIFGESRALRFAAVEKIALDGPRERDGTRRAARATLSLPGGGLEPGETEAEALRRELAEETGFCVRLQGRIGVAIEYVFASEESTYFKKIQAFCIAELVNWKSSGTDPDVRVRWVTFDEAARARMHESHLWAVRRAIGARRVRDG